jgi:TatA/E family protein of Tat protein translocase
VIALFVFGGKNFPQIGADMGRTISNFKKGISEPAVGEENPVASVKKAEDIKEQ